MVNVRKATGREPGRFKPYDSEPRIVSRMGIWGANDEDEFTSTSSEYNIAGTHSGSTYERNNILIHYIRAVNSSDGIANLAQTKQLHFWSNNTTNTQDVTADNHIFSITVPPQDEDVDGGIDVTIDFPIPLLIEGGGMMAVKSDSSSARNEEMVVTICYTVLNSLSVGNSSLRYKFLSAATTETAIASAGYVNKPGTSDPMTEDVQIWGVSMMNLLNVAGSAHMAQSHVLNADGDEVAHMIINKADLNSAPTVFITPYDCDENISGHDSEELCDAGAAGHGDGQPGHWALLTGLNFLNLLRWNSVTSSTPFKRNKGSDSTTQFFRFPMYCKGNASGSNFKIGVDTTGHTRATWFYRPVKARGLNHGWV